MPKLLPRDPDTVDRAWQLLEQGAAKREIMRVLLAVGSFANERAR